MLDARYLLLHKALGLGQMWLNKKARLAPALQVPLAKQTKSHASSPIETPPQQIAAVTPETQPEIPSQPVHTEKPEAETTQKTIAHIETAGKDLDTLASDCILCQACTLSGCRRQAIFGQGNPQAKLLILTASPTPEDDLATTLFYGKAGVLLTNMLKAIDIDIETTYLTSGVKCASGFSTEIDQTQHKTCRAFLDAQITLIKPKAILALGNDLKKWATVNEAGLNYQGVPFFVTTHPARLMRHPQEKAQAWAVLKQLRDTLQS